MEKVIAYLNGKKTYIAAIVTAVFNLLLAFQVITLDADQILSVNGLLTAVLMTTVRIGVKKSEL